DLISERLATIYQITDHTCDVLIVPVTTALYTMPPREYLAAYSFFIKKGSVLDLTAFRSQMTLAGYIHASQVVSPGEYCIRGGLIDLFPMGSPLPYRIDLFDDEIETIRTFDADTQRSIYPVKEIRLLPAREFPLDEAGRSRFRVNYREKFEGDPTRSKLYQEISKGNTPAGIEYYLPLFFEQTATLFDYLPQHSTLCLHGDIAAAIESFWQDTRSRFQLMRNDIDRPLLPPIDLFLPEDQFYGYLKSYDRIEMKTGEQQIIDQPFSLPLPSIRVDRRASNPIEQLTTFVNTFTQ